MLDPSHPIAKLLKSDPRYKFEAYVFVFEALRYAQEVLGLGTEHPRDPSEKDRSREWLEKKLPEGVSIEDIEEAAGVSSSESESEERHLTGQELCQAIRLYALEQYGYMAKSVLNHWGVNCTNDFGEIVFNLIEIGQMRKTPKDRREDFQDVFDFDEGLQQSFEITLPE